MSIFLRSDTNKAYYFSISSRTGEYYQLFILRKDFMKKTAKSVSAKNNNTEVQSAVEEIAEILCNAIKRYIALPAAVKNG